MSKNVMFQQNYWRVRPIHALISVSPSSVNTIVLSLLTVTYSTRLPQSASSNSDTASGSLFSSSMNRSIRACGFRAA